MDKKDFRLFHRLRVRWAEIDMQKIVFNAHYLMYFDTAIADYWRALALPYEEAMQLLDGDMYLRKATVEFHASARVDDRLDIGMKCGRIGNSSVVFLGAVFRGGDLLASGELVYVFADPATQTSRPVPPPLREVLQGFEAGEPMCEVLIGNWASLGEEAAMLRREVFTEEQGVPAGIELDELDAQSVHAIGRNRLGQVIATGRLLPRGGGPARIGRMAVRRVLRGGGHGAAILRALEDAARARGDREAMLHAQCDAEAFYTRLGYGAVGEPFEEAGIAHIEMRRLL